MNDAQRFRQVREAARVTEQAAAWFLDGRDGLSDVRRIEFLAWLRRSPIHVQEYLAMARLHGDMAQAAALDPLDALALAEAARHAGQVVPLHGVAVTAPAPVRWRYGSYLAVAALLAMTLLGMAGQHLLRRAAPASGTVYRADADVVRHLALPDGTWLQLDRGSAVQVDMRADARIITVLRGTALFDVAHDPARPMSVQVGSNRLQDIGTVFAVRKLPQGVDVDVLSGRVQVMPPVSPWSVFAPRPVATELFAGERVHLAEDGKAGVVHADDVRRDLAWLPEDIRFQHATVAEVARRFNAYTTQPLVIEGTALADTRISGVFHGRDVEAFLAYLKTLPRVIVHREAERVRVSDIEPSRTPARM